MTKVKKSDKMLGMIVERTCTQPSQKEDLDPKTLPTPAQVRERMAAFENTLAQILTQANETLQRSSNKV